MTAPIVRLQPGRAKRARLGSPWIFSNEVVMDSATKGIPAGEIVRFVSSDGAFVGSGSFNCHTLISGRIFSRKPVEEIDEAFFARVFEKAAASRAQFLTEPFYRLVHAEGDGLGGLVIDRFGAYFSLQANTAGMERCLPLIVSALREVFAPKGIVAHNDSPVRALEGLARDVRLLAGEIPDEVELFENGCVYVADLLGGQKTGWYFDQRDNHALVARLAKEKRVLDLYTHAGGFGVLAAKAGASSVVGVDSSAPALALAAKAAEKNGVASLCNWERADAFEDLERRVSGRERFDLVIADPPPFVKSRKDLASGAKGYRKLAKLSAGLVAPGGMLYIASCSYNMGLDAFVAEVARGLYEAKRSAQILYTTFAAPDHPVHPSLPESAYLKGVLLGVE